MPLGLSPYLATSLNHQIGVVRASHSQGLEDVH